MSLDPARRAGLERARAIALARDHFALEADDVAVDTAPFGVVVAGGSAAVVVTSSSDLAVLGGVLIWLDRESFDRVDLVCEHHGPVHARRSAALAPELTVWTLERGSVAPTTAAAIPVPPPLPPDITALVALIERSGAQVVVEDGIVRAEVAGLEVGRIVTGPEGSTLEVGVGRFDREAGVLLHAGRPVEPTMVDTIARVAEHRVPGAPLHAVNRIGRERWLRDHIRREPALVGADSLELVEPIPPRASLLESVPAAALASIDGERTLVVCSVGVDLGLVPAIADLVTRHQPDEVRIVLPARDHLPAVVRLARRVPVPTEFSPVEPPWDKGATS